MLRYLIVHLEKALLASALAIFGSALVTPFVRWRQLEPLIAATEADLELVAAHHATGAATPAPQPVHRLEATAALLGRAPPAPEPLPGWCTGRRPAFLHAVEVVERRTPRATPPEELRADASRLGCVRLSWAPGAGNDLVSVRYLLERRVDDGPWERLGETEATQFDDLAAPPRRTLGYRVTAVAERAPGLEDEVERLPAEQARLSVTLAAPVEARRPTQVRLRDVWLPADELSEETGWATLELVQLDPDGAELSRRSFQRVRVGDAIGDSGAVLREVELPLRPSRFGAPVPTPCARIVWREGDAEELAVAR